MVFFLMPGFAQTPAKSKHPLLDKYYPELKNRNKPATKPAVPAKAPTTSVDTARIKPGNIASKSTLTKPNQITSTRPLPKRNAVPVIQPVPGLDTSAIATSTETIQGPESSAIIPNTKVALNKTIKTTSPPPPKVRARPKLKEIYRDTRLGSSSPLYNNYDKNKKGAGSVTTSPKG